jgi:hypothetical protein
MRYLFLVIPLLALAACATLSEDECRGGDWYRIGTSDGAEGRRADFILQHAKACNKFGIRPNQTQWLRGREDGLPFYCTPAKAFDEGRRGQHLSPVCPADKLATLRRANERGLRLNRIEREIAEIEGRIRSLNAAASGLPPGDTARASIAAERSYLRLDLLHLRSERLRYLR